MNHFQYVTKRSILFFIIICCLMAVMTGCGTGGSFGSKKSGENFIAGIEPEEATRKIMVIVKGKGIEPATGTPLQKRLMAERAAVIDGYRKLAERLAGILINAHSESGENTVSMDQVMIETNAYLRGAQTSGMLFQNGYATVNVKVYIEPRLKQKEDPANNI